MHVYGAPFVKILYLTDLAQKLLYLPQITSLHAEIAISARDSSFCAKSVRYNIFTNGTPTCLSHTVDIKSKRLIDTWSIHLLI